MSQVLDTFIVEVITKPDKRSQKKLQKSLKTVGKAMDRFARKTDKARKKLKNFGTGAIKGLGIATGLVAGSVALLLKEFSKIEDAEAAFTPLLGGAKKAKEMVDALNETAATTPFQFTTLANSTKQLLPVMEGDIAKTVETLRMLGDTAGGNAQKLETITRGFTKAALKGKVDMESLNMISEAGVPIIKEMAKARKISTAALLKQVTAGKVSVEDLTGTFKNMTSKGGLFFKGMEIASKTLTGKLSTMRDNVSLVAGKLGSVLSPAIKKVIDRIIPLVQKLGDWFEGHEDIIRQGFEEWLVKAEKAVKDFWETIGGLEGAIKLIKVAFITWDIVMDVQVVSAIVTTIAQIGLLVKAIIVAIPIIYAKAAAWWAVAAGVIAANLPLIAMIALAVAIGVAVAILATLIVNNWDLIVEKTLDMVEKVVRFFSDIWTGITNDAKRVKNTFLSVLEWIIDKYNAVRAVFGKEPIKVTFEREELDTGRSGFKIPRKKKEDKDFKFDAGHGPIKFGLPTSHIKSSKTSAAYMSGGSQTNINVGIQDNTKIEVKGTTKKALSKAIDKKFKEQKTNIMDRFNFKAALDVLDSGVK